MSREKAGTAGSVEPPKNAQKLRVAIETAAHGRKATVKRLQALVGNVIVAQMLPDSAVKGGTGLKLRFGDTVTRETPDLDAAFRGDRERFIADLNTNLQAGWGDFTGKATAGQQRAPNELLERVTYEYVMQPAKVSLQYRKRPFMSVELEIGYDELEATTKETVDLEMSDDVLTLFAELGLQVPDPVRVLPLHHQISQKLHACSEPGSDRAHDLVDLQLMTPHADPALVRETAVRLFAFRKSHEWPPTVVKNDGWKIRYDDAAEGLEVRDLDDAVTWVNEYIGLCAAAAIDGSASS